MQLVEFRNSKTPRLGISKFQNLSPYFAQSNFKILQVLNLGSSSHGLETAEFRNFNSNLKFVVPHMG
ncbi:hypothetical protein [Campylobacter sp.]|uniref:hypothetical protein n=1 Tax=Campylobacter sp. TaxID=205 RepID=UPI0025DA55BF|nr:hypothetical protein [Campylobacter sp.]